MSTYWSMLEGISNFGYKDQSNYYTPETGALSGFTYLDCTPPEITFGRDLLELQRLTGQVGARTQPRAGSRAGGSIRFRVPLTSQTSAWDPATAVVVNPVWDLIEEIWGAAYAGTYVATAVESPLTGATTYNAWKLASGSPAIGNCYATGLAAAITSLGWCENFAANVVTLTQDAIGKPTAADNLYPLRTVYSSHTQPTAKTFLLTGDTSDQALRLYGCVPTALEIGADAKGQLIADFTYRFMDWTRTGDGATQTVTDYQEVPPLLGLKNARFTLNGADAGVAANALGTLGAGTVKLSCTLEGIPILAHGGRQGEGAWQVNRRVYKVTGQIPHVSSLVSSNKTIFDASLEDETAITVMLQAGDKPGKLFSALIPAARCMSQHTQTIADGMIVYGYDLEASTYSSDAASTNAGNSVARLAYG